MPYITTRAQECIDRENAERVLAEMEAEPASEFTSHICFDPKNEFVECVNRHGIYCDDVAECDGREPAEWTYDTTPIGEGAPQWVKGAFVGWPRPYSLTFTEDEGRLMFQSATGAAPLPAGSRLRVMSDGSIWRWGSAEAPRCRAAIQSAGGKVVVAEGEGATGQEACDKLYEKMPMSCAPKPHWEWTWTGDNLDSAPADIRKALKEPFPEKSSCAMVGGALKVYMRRLAEPIQTVHPGDTIVLCPESGILLRRGGGNG
jgi:hypothetical protein